MLAVVVTPQLKGTCLLLLVFLYGLQLTLVEADPFANNQGFITRTCDAALLTDRDDLPVNKDHESSCSFEIDVQVTHSVSALTCAVVDIQNNEKDGIYNWQLSWDFEGEQKLKVTDPQDVVVVSTGAVGGAPIRVVNPTDRPNIEGNGGYTRFLVQFLNTNETQTSLFPAINSVFFNGQQCSSTNAFHGPTCSLTRQNTTFSWYAHAKSQIPVCRSHFCCRFPWIPWGDIILAPNVGSAHSNITTNKTKSSSHRHNNYHRQHTLNSTSQRQRKSVSIAEGPNDHAPKSSVSKAKILLVPIDELMTPTDEKPPATPSPEPAGEPAEKIDWPIRPIHLVPPQEEVGIPPSGEEIGKHNDQHLDPNIVPSAGNIIGDRHKEKRRSKNRVITHKLVVIVLPVVAGAVLLLVVLAVGLVRRRKGRRELELESIKSQIILDSGKGKSSPDSLYRFPSALASDRSSNGSLRGTLRLVLPDDVPQTPLSSMSRSSSMPSNSARSPVHISRLASIPGAARVTPHSNVKGHSTINLGPFSDAPRLYASQFDGDLPGVQSPFANKQPCLDSPAPPRLNLPLHLTSAVSSGTLNECQVANIDFAREVILEHKLGHGGFGQVFAARWKNKYVAVKMVPFLEGYSEGFSSQSLRGIQQEMSVMSQIKHENIISFIGACLVPPNVCIVEELALGGSLHDRIYRKGTQWEKADLMTYKEILHVAIDVASAMSYLHPGIVHRDLKPQNVLLDLDGRAKVCDFGIAKMKDRTFVSTKNVHAGTPSYMAPELFEGSPVSEKVDCFSFGVLLWECFASRQPWADHLNPMRIIFAVGVQGERLPVPAECPAEMKKLMQQCWEREAALRPPFLDILACLQAELQRLNLHSL